jgi:hypothetical protein
MVELRGSIDFTFWPDNGHETGDQGNLSQTRKTMGEAG